MKIRFIIYLLFVSIFGFGQSGTSASYNHLASLIQTTIDVDQSFVAKANVTGDANQPNVIQTLASQRADAGLTIAGNVITNNIGGDYVEIDVVEYFQQNNNAAYQRINPELQLLKNGAVVATSASGYQRHATGHDSSSNSIGYVDHNPAVGDTWQLRSQQGSTQNDVLNIDIGRFSVTVTEKVTVLATSIIN